MCEKSCSVSRFQTECFQSVFPLKFYFSRCFMFKIDFVCQKYKMLCGGLKLTSKTAAERLNWIKYLEYLEFSEADIQNGRVGTWNRRPKRLHVGHVWLHFFTQWLTADLPGVYRVHWTWFGSRVSSDILFDQANNIRRCHAIYAIKISFRFIAKLSVSFCNFEYRCKWTTLICPMKKYIRRFFI